MQASVRKQRQMLEEKVVRKLRQSETGKACVKRGEVGGEGDKVGHRKHRLSVRK
jgi:hypothetical protein